MSRLIRWPEVERRTGHSRTTIYKLMHEGQFPPFVRISARAVGWVEEEIDEYVVNKIKARDSELVPVPER